MRDDLRHMEQSNQQQRADSVRVEPGSRHRGRRLAYAAACVALVIVILGLLAATWMPALLQTPTTRPAATQQS